ncbi:hypothetical protein N7492_009403 [Penicillium capsulatum]|uniref:Uncharacterized protein n=1 Tax=Penicillium capsulatum TaxID=69766 RepID=A0A9W9HUU8_9EURO|nr:hypothetical protein N7492_009403 [Penicillium capsulatum]KAJ6106796.1 hypothetical protein N7512_010313 [Penicillium capsulatum]
MKKRLDHIHLEKQKQLDLSPLAVDPALERKPCWATPNTGGFIKLSVVNAMFFISYCVGNIVGIFLFKSSEAPAYTSGIVAMLVAYCVEIFLLLGFGAFASALNRTKRKRCQERVYAMKTYICMAQKRIKLTERENSSVITSDKLGLSSEQEIGKQYSERVFYSIEF